MNEIETHKDYRSRLNLTTADLAEMTGFTEKHIVELERDPMWESALNTAKLRLHRTRLWDAIESFEIEHPNGKPLVTEPNTELDNGEIDFIMELLMEYRRAVERNDISGYGQSKADELHDTDVKVGKLMRLKKA